MDCAETSGTQHVMDFYTRHPISAEHILAKLSARHGRSDGFRPEDLWPLDQDHYGGLAANDEIARLTGMHAGQRVADFCAGLGGPARYFAVRHGVRVTGVELTPHRVVGARQLTAAVGLSAAVDVVEGDVMAPPMADRSVDIVYSQEALLHVPDKQQAIAQAARILIPGGRLCFTDWIAHRPLTADESATMWQGIAAQAINTIDRYRDILAQARFEIVQIDDLTKEWATVLEERRRMYSALREETIAAGKPAGDEQFYQAYVRLVELVRTGVLGGARFVATLAIA